MAVVDDHCKRRPLNSRQPQRHPHLRLDRVDDEPEREIADHEQAKDVALAVRPGEDPSKERGEQPQKRRLVQPVGWRGCRRRSPPPTASWMVPMRRSGRPDRNSRCGRCRCRPRAAPRRDRQFARDAQPALRDLDGDQTADQGADHRLAAQRRAAPASGRASRPGSSSQKSNLLPIAAPAIAAAMIHQRVSPSSTSRACGACAVRWNPMNRRGVEHPVRVDLPRAHAEIDRKRQAAIVP